MSGDPEALARPIGWRGRVALVAIGLAMLGAVELGLRLCGAAAESASGTSGFSGSPPLYVKQKPSDGSERYVLHPARRLSFPMQSFAVDRARDTRLVFCVGGSSVYGYPYGADIAFPHQLEGMLARRYPAQRFEVVNVGGLSYGSEREALLVDELVHYHPDLIVLYTGHNEFVEDDFQGLAGGRGFSQGLARQAQGLALYRALSWVAGRAAPEPPTAAAESFGVDVERREGRFVAPEERARALARFRRNVTRMVDTALGAGVTPVLATVGVNLGGWHPEAGSTSPELSDEQVLRFGLAEAQGMTLESRDSAGALAAYERALAIDGGHAEVSYAAARVLRQLGRGAQARALYLRALETDAAPIRSLPEFNRALREIARDEHVALVDVEPAFDSTSADGIPDGGLYFDYCHPNPRGHELIARALLPVSEGLLKLDPAAAVWTAADPPPPAPAPTAFALWWQGNVALRQGRAREALEFFNASLALKPDEYRPLAGLALALQATGQDVEALVDFQRAASLAPRSVLAHNQLGIALARLGRAEEAIAVFAAAIDLDPRARGIRNNLGGAYLARGELDRAAAALAEEYRLGPHLVGLNRNLGLVALARGDLPAAADRLMAELRLNPSDGRSALYLAQTWEKRGRRDAARLAAQLALAREPHGEQAMQLAARLESEAAQASP